MATVEVSPRAGGGLRLGVLQLLLSRELREEMDDTEPPGKDDEGLNYGDGRRQHLELGWQIRDAEQDGQEEEQLEDAEDDEPWKKKEAHPTRGPDHQDDRGENQHELKRGRDQNVKLENQKERHTHKILKSCLKNRFHVCTTFFTMYVYRIIVVYCNVRTKPLVWPHARSK